MKTIPLYGDIGFDVLLSDLANELKAANGEDVTVRIFSYGGKAAEGLAMYNILSGYRGKVTTYIDGAAVSAAGLPFIAGAERIMPENTLFHLHITWGFAEGNAEKFRGLADQLDATTNSIADIYAKKTKQDKAKIMEWMHAGQGVGTWFTAADALALGFATAIDAPVDIQASVAPTPPPSLLSNAPPMLREWVNMSKDCDSRTTMAQAAQQPADAAPIAPPAATLQATEAVQASVTPSAASHEPELAALRREAEIRRCAAQARLEPEAIDALVANGKPFQEVAVEIVRAAAQRLESRSEAGHPARMQIIKDQGDMMMEGLQEHIYARVNPKATVTENGKRFRHFNLFRCAEIFAQSRGLGDTETRSKSEIVAYAMHSSTDFPLLFSNTANKRLTDAYEEEPHTFKLISQQQNLPDFKDSSDLIMASDLMPVELLEGGEYRAGTMKEAQATWRLSTYARKIQVTRKAIINDDLSSIDRLPLYLGRGFRRLESNLVWALITGNSITSVDGLALFDTAHKNTGTGPIGVAGMAAGTKAMRKQTDISGAAVNLTPAYMMVPTDLEATARQFLFPDGYAPATLTGANGPNPYSNSVQLIVEPRLDGSATQWYLAASPTRIDGLFYGYLADEPGPTITSVPERDPDGLTLLARFDFGCTIKDYRAFYRSSGS